MIIMPARSSTLAAAAQGSEGKREGARRVAGQAGTIRADDKSSGAVSYLIQGWLFPVDMMNYRDALSLHIGASRYEGGEAWQLAELC